MPQNGSNMSPMAQSTPVPACRTPLTMPVGAVGLMAGCTQGGQGGTSNEAGQSRASNEAGPVIIGSRLRYN